MCSKHTEKTKFHVQPTRNTRNFILGTCSLLSADFYKLFIHLVEGNTRIVERKKFTQRMGNMITCGLVHPEDRTVCTIKRVGLKSCTPFCLYCFDCTTKYFGFYSRHYSDDDYFDLKHDIQYHLLIDGDSEQKEISREKIKQLFIERFGPGAFGVYEGWGCDVNVKLNIDELVLRDIIKYECENTEEIKIRKFNEHTKLCNISIKKCLNNETKMEVEFISDYDLGDYITDEEYSSYENIFLENGIPFQIFINSDHWEPFKEMLNANQHILNGTLNMTETDVFLTPE